MSATFVIESTSDNSDRGDHVSRAEGADGFSRTCPIVSCNLTWRPRRALISVQYKSVVNCALSLVMRLALLRNSGTVMYFVVLMLVFSFRALALRSAIGARSA